MSNFIAQQIQLSHAVAPILALGAYFNNSVCLTLGDQALLSRNLGNLDNVHACREHETIARHLLTLCDKKPQAIAHDLHPDFYSSRFAAQLANELNVPLIPVQHHHAHIAAICAESHWEKPILGLALDGVGLGNDGQAWGGELLQIHGASLHRLGHLLPLALPGGDRAATEPWRMAAAALHAIGRGAEITLRFNAQPAAATVSTMLERQLNCPRSSSLGRVFDAAAGLLKLCAVMQFDAAAAIALEQAANRHIHTHGDPPPLMSGWLISPQNQLNLLPLLAYLADESDRERGAAIFHSTLAAALQDWIIRAVQCSAIDTVACGGGCWLNSLLRQKMAQLAYPKCIFSQQISPGDAGIALGQAWVAANQTLA